MLSTALLVQVYTVAHPCFDWEVGLQSIPLQVEEHLAPHSPHQQQEGHDHPGTQDEDMQNGNM